MARQRQHRQQQRLVVLAMVALLVVALVAAARPADGQFFTKATKSIPRMGRRSEPADPNRVLLLESLAEELAVSHLS